MLRHQRIRFVVGMYVRRGLGRGDAFVVSGIAEGRRIGPGKVARQERCIEKFENIRNIINIALYILAGDSCL
ncbi:MAG: hypothetical protein GC159_07050 [Phycisphaera sp.]|nr:hypothetical protein [Phycisphaera sp.]